MENLKKDSYKLSIYIILITIISYAAKYVFNLMLSHLLPEGMYGDFSIGLKTFNIFSVMVLLGTATAAKRFLSYYLHIHQEQNIFNYIRWNLRLIYLSSIIFTIFLAALISVMLILHVFNIKNITTYHIAFYLLFLTPFGAFAILLSSYLQCNENIFLYNFFTNGGRFFVYIILIAAAIYFFHVKFNYLSLWLITLLMLCFLNLIEISLVLKYLPYNFFKILFSKLDKQASMPEWKKTSRRLILNQIFYLVLCAVDLYAVKFFTHKPIYVDYYAAILTIAGTFWLATNSIFSLITPKISLYLETYQKEKLQAEINRGNAINLLLQSIFLIILLFWGSHILRSFGPAYATPVAYKTLLIMAIGYAFGSFSRSSTLLLAFSGNEIYLVWGSIGELILITVSATILTIFYGIVGAATASTLTILIKAITYIIIARKQLKVKPITLW